VKLPHGAAYPKSKVVLPLVAAVAMFAASIAPASAASGPGGTSAGSGGVSTGDDGGTEDAPAQAAKYERLWDHVSRRDRRWARSTAECESGGDPKAVGGSGKFRGAFQFLKSTWRNSPKSPGGDPVDYPYRTQAVVAVALKRHDGGHHWPVCG
jgi:Transglycosylase-like domain